MEFDNSEFLKDFYRCLESGIESLPDDMRARLYRPCAEGCVKRFVLGEQKRQFDECGGDLDAQYEKYGRSQYFFADIIEKGRVYEIGYPTTSCVCPIVSAGLAASKAHCECSRQSMLCVLETLLPDKKITAELMHSVLTGAGECRFRVTVSEKTPD